MKQKTYILFIIVVYIALIINYFLFDYLAFLNTWNDSTNNSLEILKNLDYISNNILNNQKILTTILVFVLIWWVIDRLRKLRMRFIWLVLMLIPWLNFIFTIILAFIKDKNNLSEDIKLWN